VSHAFCRVERYGFSEDADWRIANLRHEDGKSLWEVHRNGALWAKLEMQMAGEHNALNATAAAALAANHGVPVAAIQEALAGFLSVKRRLEVRTVIDGITIIDDFAHHPTAIRETLRALRQAYPGVNGKTGRLWAVLEPRSNTLRRNVFQRELVESLSLADAVILDAVYQQQRIPEGERLHPEQVIAALNDAGTPAELCADVAAIVDSLDRQLHPGDVVAILSNGGFDGIYDKLPARLLQRSALVAEGIMKA
jgi:UDP-N-acetylmuramate: L-alanyl-gamma-D-glutamyl-meso-diaminopimelate ligase